MRIAGVVVWYNPTANDKLNINSYINELDKLYIVDNSDNINELDFISNKIEYIFNGNNIGIASALNLACKKAIEDKYDYILTMDQDSKFINDGLIKMINRLSNIDIESVGIISPWHNTKLKLNKPKDVMDYPLDVMTSGNILNLNIYQKIGGFKDFLFIDGVDIEYCLNLKKNGYKVLRMNDCVLNHDLGDIFYKKFFNKEFMCDNHNYIRIYYMTRNYRYIKANYNDVAPEFCNTLVKIKGLIFKIFFYEKDKFRKLRSILYGIHDYKKGKYGKYNR